MVKSEILGKSALNTEIHLHRLGPENLPKLLLIGGVHGDEPEGTRLVEDFIQHASPIANQFKCSVLAIPRLNPDGLDQNERINGNGVDLNRNFPAQDWSSEHKSARYYPGTHAASEPEVHALVQLIRRTQPFLIIHCHSYIPQVCYTGVASKPWADILGKNFEGPVTEDIGYPTPGSLGQYSLLDLKTPCVCIELPERVERARGWNMVGPALLEIAQSGP